MAIQRPSLPEGKAALQAVLVDALGSDKRSREQAFALLREQSSIYDGKTGADAERLRGSLLVGLGAAGLPSAALPLVMEDLATGQSPFAVAAAARALRGSETLPEGIADILLAAIERMRGADDALRFEPSSPEEKPTSALDELFRTLAWAAVPGTAVLDALESLRDREPRSVPPEAAAELALAIKAVRAVRPHAACCSGPTARAFCEAVSPRRVAASLQQALVAPRCRTVGDRDPLHRRFGTRCLRRTRPGAAERRRIVSSPAAAAQSASSAYAVCCPHGNAGMNPTGEAQRVVGSA